MQRGTLSHIANRQAKQKQCNFSFMTEVPII